MSRATTNHSFVPQGQSDQSRIPVTMETRSPAQAFALVVGATLVVAGIAGFFYNASFGTGDGTERDAVLGIFDVNGWSNVLHVLTGAIGLAVSGAWDGSRVYALGFGAIYLVVPLLQLLDRSMYQHLRRSFGAAHRPRDLFVVHAEREAHDEGLAAVVRQLRHAPEHLLHPPPPLDHLLGPVWGGED